MSKYMDTKELSRYLGINEKKVYKLVAEKRLPATKITGKWIFLKDLVDIWIEDSIENYPKALERLKGILMITGSNDPLLELIINEVKRTSHNLLPYLLHTGSLKGLLVLKEDKAHISSSHLLDKESGEYNLSFISSYLPDSKIVVVNFAHREQGLIVKSDNPLKIKGIEDLSRPKIKFINRNKGSGTRILLDIYLKEFNISVSKIKGYGTEVTTHFEVGLRVLKGLADVGMGIRAVANILGLGFIPLRKERLDLLIPKNYFFFPEIQTLLEILKSYQFKRKAGEFGGYDTKDSGRIIYA